MHVQFSGQASDAFMLHPRADDAKADIGRGFEELGGTNDNINAVEWQERPIEEHQWMRFLKGTGKEDRLIATDKQPPEPCRGETKGATEVLGVRFSIQEH